MIKNISMVVFILFAACAILYAQGIFDPGAGTTPAESITGTVAVSKGGTSTTTFTSNGVLVGNGTSAIAVTSAGTADQVFRVPGAGGTPAFGTVDLGKAAARTGTLPTGNGGTGITGTPTNGQLPIGNGAGYTLAGLTGTANQIIVTNGAGTITLSTPFSILSATATLDFPLSAATGCDDRTMTVTGAKVGNVVVIGVPNGSVGAESNFFGWVSAADTVTIKHCTHTLATDPASGTFRATVLTL